MVGQPAVEIVLLLPCNDHWVSKDNLLSSLVLYLIVFYSHTIAQHYSNIYLLILLLGSLGPSTVTLIALV